MVISTRCRNDELPETLRIRIAQKLTLIARGDDVDGGDEGARLRRGLGSAAMSIVLGQVWTFWIAVFLVVPSILLVLGVIVGYVYKVVMPRYPQALTPWRARSTGASPSGWRSAPPAVSPSPRATTTTRSQPDFDRLTAQAEQLVEAETGLRSLAGPARARVTDRAGWVRANLVVVPAPAAPVAREVRRPRRLRPRRPAHDPPGRRRAGHGARLDVGPGARPVRPAGHRGGGPGRPGPRLLRGPQRARPREAVRLPARAVPAVAGPARGHPPGPVHRRAVAAGALPRAGARDPRRGRPRPQAPPRRREPHGRRRAGRARTRSPTAAW